MLNKAESKNRMRTLKAKEVSDQSSTRVLNMQSLPLKASHSTVQQDMIHKLIYKTHGGQDGFQKMNISVKRLLEMNPYGLLETDSKANSNEGEPLNMSYELSPRKVQTKRSKKRSITSREDARTGASTQASNFNKISHRDIHALHGVELFKPRESAKDSKGESGFNFFNPAKNSVKEFSDAPIRKIRSSMTAVRFPSRKHATIPQK